MRYEHRSILVGVAALAATATSVTALADPDLEKRSERSVELGLAGRRLRESSLE